MSGYEVDFAAVRADAEGAWTRWSTTLRSASGAVPAQLDPFNFSVIPGAQDVAAVYLATAGALRDYLAGGAERYEAVADALEGSVGRYEQAETTAEREIAARAAELEAQ